jgi:acyl carrier protein
MIGDVHIIAIGDWASALLIMGGVLLLGTVLVLLDLPRIRRLRRKHVKTHPCLSSEEFIRQGDFPREHETIALGVREGVANAMGVATETVYPADRLDYVVQFAFDNIDLLDLKLFIGEALQVRVPIGLFEVPKGKEDIPPLDTVADLATYIAENRRQLIDTNPKPEVARL